ncbi:TRAP transporter substrate-binding protein DctP [Planococcus sp. ISL-110]|uniref:TRAP transporter substrate-binding protein n=1 Tax=Planococcus sp. ISL-110 TaxID=2819167 RepID=UPI001BE4E584|nr:TRAP transporter substrate-binding protein DctP [Planococcus sp. ISL-110]MBT2570115.1 TRAP transporter substrate-binding protein DctP [Planococcus sp. ISL-110]
MFSKKNSTLLILLILMPIFLFACGSDNTEGSEATASDDSINIRFAHEESQGDVQDLYANKFKELIEEETDGRVSVDVYTTGTLGGNDDMFTQLQTGAVDMAITSPGFTGSVIPQTQIMNIPYLFSNNPEVNRKVLDESEALYGTLADKYEEKGLEIFKFWTEGSMYWTGNKKITEPTDMKGLKMRGMPTDMIMESYKLMGADPQATDSGEIYTMLQTGGIDGQENPLFFIYNSNFHEVQDYLMDSKHHIYITATVANSEWFSSLAEEDQKLVNEIMQEVNDWSFTMQQEEEEKAMAEIKKSDMEIIELTEDQRESFKELVAPIRDVYIENGGDGAEEILKIIEQDIQAAEEELK